MDEVAHRVDENVAVVSVLSEGRSAGVKGLIGEGGESNRRDDVTHD